MALKGHGTKFGRKMEPAVAALLTQRNIDEAARSIGVSPNTLLKWMKVPEFQAAYREGKRAAFSQAVERPSNLTIQERRIARPLRFRVG